MKFPSKEIVERVRHEYPVGCRVELVHMDDVQAPPIGTKGTVIGVDDTASIMVKWGAGVLTDTSQPQAEKHRPSRQAR